VSHATSTDELPPEPVALRAVLAPAAWLYGAIVALRNMLYDRRWLRIYKADAPVISVGNLTVGGTGKTPVVLELWRRLVALRRRPAILTRGYAAARGQPADEVLEMLDEAPDALVVVEPDRVAGAGWAIDARAVDCLLLDDGFQHRRLARDLDIVLIDALRPWGGGRLLPAGRLREPRASLRRAQVVLVTRANQVEAGRVSEIAAEITRLAPRARVLTADVRPTGLLWTDAAGERRRELAALACTTPLPVCGLGNPASFVAAVEELCAAARRPLLFRDHHRYAARDVARILQAARQAGADAVVVSRKDWVKLAPLWAAAGAAAETPLVRLDARMEIQDPTGALDAALRRALRMPPAASPEQERAQP